MKRVGTLLLAIVVCCLVAGARGDDAVKLPLDNDFLVKVATCNHAAIAIGKMAEKQADSADVKVLAVHLVKDHQGSYDKLAELLKTRKVGVVAGTEAETKSTIQRLGKLEGAEFDKEYLQWVVKEHRAGILLFENQIKHGTEADINAYAKETLVTCRNHLQKAEKLAKSLSAK